MDDDRQVVLLRLPAALVSQPSVLLPGFDVLLEPVGEGFMNVLVDPLFALGVDAGTEGVEEEGPEVGAAEISEQLDLFGGGPGPRGWLAQGRLP